MVEILAEFPKVRQTFNLVPSMVAQIEEYAAGTASDPFLDVAVTPAEDLDRSATRLHADVFVSSQRAADDPSLSSLSGTVRCKNVSRIEHSAILRDLQVLVSWSGSTRICWHATRSWSDLVHKGRDYSREDQGTMARKQREALERVLPVYRDFAERGQIEISTTPFYHPILPLICDSEIAGVSHPGVTLPRDSRYPEDAREQLIRARVVHAGEAGRRAGGIVAIGRIGFR